MRTDIDDATARRPLDDVRAFQASFEIGDPLLEARLLFLRSEILGVLGELPPHVERLPQVLCDLLPANGSQAFELAL